MVFFAAVNFGLFFHDYLFFTQAVRDGSRYAAIQGPSIRSTAVQSKIIQIAGQTHLYLLTPAAADISVSWTTDSAIVSWSTHMQVNMLFMNNLNLPVSYRAEMPREQ
jgi:hypothetical protein